MLVKEETRKLARAVRIDEIKPIPKADRLEIAVVGGWECIVPKGEYKAGDLALYFEIDSAIPLDHELWADFDQSRLRVVEHEGKQFAVIKTLKLRGVRSQGLVLSLNRLGRIGSTAKADYNYTDYIGVLKYVSPAEAKLYREASNEPRNMTATRKLIWRLRNWLIKDIIVDGLLPWPTHLVKSDEQRVQNVSALHARLVKDEEPVELSVKLDGESATFYTAKDTDDIGVAQRNHSLRLKPIQYTFKEQVLVYLAAWLRYIPRKLAGAYVSFPRWATQYDPKTVPLVRYFFDREIMGYVMTANAITGKKVSLQGEMVGPNFNGGAEFASTNEFYCYRVYTNGTEMMPPEQARDLCKVLGIKYVPVVSSGKPLTGSIKDLLKLADGPGHFEPKRPREGLVAKSEVTGESMKIISNAWLEAKDAEAEEAAKAAEGTPVAA